MFGFTRNKDDVVVLNQKLGRLLNDHYFSDVGNETQRCESRMRLALPCLMFLFKEAARPRCYAVAITSDISLRGLSLYATDQLDAVDYVMVLGPKDKRLYIKASCKRCQRADFGAFAVGFEFIKVLNPKDYPAIVQAVSDLDMPTPTPIPIATEVTSALPFARS